MLEEENPAFHVTESTDPKILSVNIEGLSRETQHELWKGLSDRLTHPIHSETVEHGYSYASGLPAEQCPRCQSETEQRYAHFIYATDIAPRLMFVPAGFFCTRCPTVIIDEKMIITGVKKGYKFQGVVGIDHEGKREPSLFRTWNGKKAVHILDEDGKPLGLSTVDSSSPGHGESVHRPSKSFMKTKHKRRMAKDARRKNRKG